MITAKRLASEIARHEHAAAILKEAAALLNGAARAKKATHMAGVMAAAVTIERKRKQGQRGADKKPRKVARRKSSGVYSAKAQAQREQSAKALAVIKAEGAMTSAEIVKATGVKIQWTGPMRSRGYLRRGSDGKYSRTAKPFIVDKRAKPVAAASA